MNINEITICGRITKDIDMRTTPSGTSVGKFSVATNHTWKGQDGKKNEETEFHDVVAWGKTAEIISQYFAKGDEIYVRGRMKTSSWEAQDGSKRYRKEIILEKFEFGQKSKANQGKRAEQGEDREYDAGYQEPEPKDNNYGQGPDDIRIEDIPF